MTGPIVTLVSGHRRWTAWAIRCAVEWRYTSRASGSRSVRIRIVVSCSIGWLRSIIRPSTWATMAALARRAPIRSATSRGVAPFGVSSDEPSGSVIVMFGAWGTITEDKDGKIERPGEVRHPAGPGRFRFRSGARFRQYDLERVLAVELN